MNNNINIFLLEDDINFGTILKSYLELNGFDVTWVDDGKDAINVFSNSQYDICILDVMLPNVDGFTIAKKIKNINIDIPLVFLTAKTLKTDILQGFNLGADDYITKPFDSEVLICKINAILNRKTVSNNNIKMFVGDKIGKYTFNYELRTLQISEEKIKLSPKEAELLKMLCVYKNNILPREKALRSIWGEDNYFTTRSMDVFLTKLRKHLQQDPDIQILNIHGSGFRLLTGGEI